MWAVQYCSVLVNEDAKFGLNCPLTYFNPRHMGLKCLSYTMVIIVTWLLDLMEATYFSSGYSPKCFGLLKLIIIIRWGLWIATNNTFVSPNKSLYCKLMVNKYNNWNKFWGKLFTGAPKTKLLMWIRWMRFIAYIFL